MKPVYTYYPLTDPEGLQLYTQATELFVNEDPEFETLPDDLQAAVEYGAENKRPVTAEKTGEKEEKEEVAA